MHAIFDCFADEAETSNVIAIIVSCSRAHDVCFCVCNVYVSSIFVNDIIHIWFLCVYLQSVIAEATLSKQFTNFISMSTSTKLYSSFQYLHSSNATLELHEQSEWLVLWFSRTQRSCSTAIYPWQIDDAMYRAAFSSSCHCTCTPSISILPADLRFLVTKYNDSTVETCCDKR